MKNKYYYGVLPLVLFALFSISVILCLVFGAKIYSRVSNRDNEAFTARTASQYVSVKIRQSEALNEIITEDFEGASSVVIPSYYDGERYITRLYCYEGYLCELFCPGGVAMSRKDGEKVVLLSDFDAEITDTGMLYVCLTSENGEETELYFGLRGSEGRIYEE